MQTERAPEALLRVAGHAHERRAARALSIAVSRETGALGTSVARAVGKRLGWQVYDQELLQKLADDKNWRVEQLESMDEREVGWLNEMVHSWASDSFVSQTAFVRALAETILTLGQRGHCVIVGRGAAQLLAPSSTLRVRLVAAMEDRIRVIRQEKRLSADEAARYIETTDRERIRYLRDHFQMDPTDPLGYDLILNSSRFPVEECVDIVLAALRNLEKRVSVERAS
ncbi:MAG: cytidylate kinase-like family protein [Gemmataceae bacterium]|nr:cytidylate kinase-like family protein [Gemmataceae bacterium]